MNDGAIQLTILRFEGLRAILVAPDGRKLETVAANLPPGTRQGSVVRVTVEHGRPTWATAALEPAGWLPGS